jgi:hydroxyethylthiazole kinase-like uncharacterized protein yjeF
MAGHEILTVAQAAAADHAAEQAGVASFDLLRNAGTAVARTVAERWTPRPVLVLCGPGLNGGDGYVAARELAAQGWRVRVAALAEPGPEDARRARDLWAGDVEPLDAVDIAGAGLIIDALFGAGLSRPLDPAVAALLRSCEASDAPLVAVDLPSGLAGDTGRPWGYAPQARLTVTFHRKKPAHVLQPGRALCGEIVVADIGIPETAAPPTTLTENQPGEWLAQFPWPGIDAHKHSRGTLGVVSGGATSTGAARLAARAGLRAGAGLVRVYCAPQAVFVLAPVLEAIMLQAFKTPAELEQAAGALDAVVIGPAAGVDARTQANVEALARTTAALVVDADALSVFRDDPARLFALLDDRDVITPHPGEFERLFPGLLASAPERITAARQAAQEAGAVVILKGPDTVIAAPDGRAAVNTNGTPWLATAGSGDVLAGICGALLSQGMESFPAACAAVWAHARTAELFGPGLTAEDLPDLMPETLDELFSSSHTVL